jgi:HlyD family secretion protein
MPSRRNDMRSALRRSLLAVLGISFLGTFAFLIYTSRERTISYTCEEPVVMDILQKTVTTGVIIPEREIEVRSRLSGIVDRLHVEAGDVVEAGEPLATIRVIPDSMDLNHAQQDLEKARILLEQAEEEMLRRRRLYDRHAIAKNEYLQHEVTYRLAKADYEAAEDSLLLLREGVTASGRVANEIVAPIAGTVLEIPVKIGSSIAETNSYKDGTTIALIADMNRLVFEGLLDESEIGKVEIGMPLEVLIAAMGEAVFDARLEFIAPKGEENQGTVQFRIRAAVEIPSRLTVRAGYSANADIVLARADRVLAISEKNVILHDGQSSVEIETGPGRFERRDVELGLSDGIMVEIRNGLSPEDRVKEQTGSDSVGRLGAGR